MLLGESALLAASVLVMLGMVKKITARLGMNDYVTAFFIFVIVLLNVRGGVKLTNDYSLSLGGVLSVVIACYVLLRRSERVSDFLFASLSAIGCAGIVFIYTLHFSTVLSLDPRILATLLALLAGLWCAFSARRTFAACLFSSIIGAFLGVTIHQIIFLKCGNIGGSYAFAVMWLGAIFGIVIQYLLTIMLRSIKSPRANSYFEAGEMSDESNSKE